MSNSYLAQDVLAEQAVLSNLFNEPTVVDLLSEILVPSEFFEPKNELIFQAILKLRQEGKAFDPVSLMTEMSRDDTLAAAGGPLYIYEIVSPNNIASYGNDVIGHATAVKENARRRVLTDAAEAILQAARLGSGLSAEEATILAEKTIYDITNEEAISNDVYKVADLYAPVTEEVRRAKDRPEGVMAGIPTGFPDLDKKTNGFKPGQLIFIAARPGIGKSTLAVDFCRAAAFLAEKTVLFFSLEMSKEEITERIISAEARVALQDLRSGNVTKEDWMNIDEVENKIKTGTFLVDPSPNVSLSKIRSLSVRQQMKPEGLDMIVIDYLQLMEVPKGSSKGASRQEQVSELSRGLKLLAKELQIPVIVLSQLNRSSETRVDRVPQVSDLRESGSLEQDADIVFLIHRPEAGDENNRPGETDLIIGKHRSGPTGKIPLTSMLEYSKFVQGQGIFEREEERVGDGTGTGDYTATADETPW